MLAARFLPFDRNSGSCRGVGHAVQKGRDIGRSDGFAEQVSLSFGASIGFQICQLPGVFDAFGGSLQAKSFCETEDGAHDHLGVGFSVRAPQSCDQTPDETKAAGSAWNNRVVQNSRSCADRRDDCHRLVQCGVTIDARYGTNDPDNSCPPTKPELTFDSDAAGSLGFTAVYLNRQRFSKRNR